MTESNPAIEIETPLSGYKAKLVAGQCTERGCDARPADGASMCAPCHRAYKKRNAEAQQRKREARREAGLCIWCPGEEPNPATPGDPESAIRPTSCLPCRIKRNRMRRADGGVTGDVTDTRSAAIAAATRKDADGRSRYHGQGKRGQQPLWKLNLQDVRHVREDFETFEQAIQALATPEMQQRHASDRVEAELATAYVGERMTRRTGDILERLGHARQRHGRRPGETAVRDDAEDGTLVYKRTSDAPVVAAAAAVGLYVYAPPLDVVSGRRETAKEPKPPDLGPLRAALAKRGLGLVAEGAFYWRVERRDGDKE